MFTLRLFFGWCRSRRGRCFAHVLKVSIQCGIDCITVLITTTVDILQIHHLTLIYQAFVCNIQYNVFAKQYNRAHCFHVDIIVLQYRITCTVNRNVQVTAVRYYLLLFVRNQASHQKVFSVAQLVEPFAFGTEFLTVCYRTNRSVTVNQIPATITGKTIQRSIICYYLFAQTYL